MWLHVNLKPLTSTALILTAATALSACSALDMLGPRPDQKLEALYFRAVEDAATLAEQTPELADLRASQADALLVEIQRLCGVDPSGVVPISCEVEPADPRKSGDTENEVPEGIINAALMGTVLATAKVPEESRDLLTTQSIELAAADGDTSLPETPAVTAEADLMTARGLLEQELATEYGLSVALAFADLDTRDLIEALLTAQRERILALQLLLQGRGDVPEPEPGYEFDTLPEPVDPTSARAFTETIAADNQLRWQSAAAVAESTSWRSFAVEAAAHAAAVPLS